MEALFAHTYLLLFGKIAVGGLLSLAVPPFADIERGFYKSTAAVYLACALAATCGDTYLWWNARGGASPVGTFTVVAWIVHASLFSAYTATLFIELPILRARLFPAALFAGFVALIAASSGFAPAAAPLLGAIPHAVDVLAGCAALGAASSGMLLGHWYLIDTGLDLEPLSRMTGFYRRTLWFEGATVAACALIVGVFAAWPTTLADAVDAHAWLLTGRAFSWTLAVLLGVLITKTIAIPQTMAATGLFYIAALVVAVGQIVSHWLLFRTGLPL